MGAPGNPVSLDGAPPSDHPLLENQRPNGTGTAADSTTLPMPPEPAAAPARLSLAKFPWKWIILISIFVASAFFVIGGILRRGSGQEVTSRLPEVTSRSPDVTSRLPDVTSRLPNVTSQLWIQNGPWDYLFSKTAVTWDESWKKCSSYGAFLVPLDTLKERAFIEGAKLLQDTWIDLRRKSPHESWRYSNGTTFDDRFDIENSYGYCAYWNVEHISSTRCNNTRFYICRRAAPKPE